MQEDSLQPLGKSANRLALELRIPDIRMIEIDHVRSGVVADTGRRLRGIQHDGQILVESAGFL